MKSLFLSVACLLFIGNSISFGQASTISEGEIAGIAITPVVPPNDPNIPKECMSQMKNIMTKITTKNGMGGNGMDPRFIIVPHVQIIAEEVVPGTVKMNVYQLEVTFVIADAIEKNVFSTLSLPATGGGRMKDAALRDAFNKLQITGPEIKTFIADARKKIIDYYNAKCDAIITDAKTKSSQKKYEDALKVLSVIPDACKDCFNKAQAEMVTVYKGYTTQLCNENLASAKSAWIAGQNADAANQAGVFLSNILPDASCYGEAQKLVAEIKNKVLADWKFEMKKYNDEIDLEKQRIKAMRDIGVAYGQNQPDVVYDVSFIVW